MSGGTRPLRPVLRKALAATLAVLAAPAVAQKPGDTAVVVADGGAVMVRDERVAGTVPRGGPVKVEKAEGRRLLVSWDAARGWIDAAATSPPQEAVDRLTAELRRRPSADLYVARGLAWTAVMGHDLAILDFGDAIRLDPGNAAAHAYRGAAWQFKRERAKAYADFDAASRLAPDWYVPHALRGMLTRASGEGRLAAKEYDRAIELAPGRAALHAARGVARRDALNYPGAAEDFAEAVRLDPGFPAGYALRGTMRLENGDVNGGLADLSEAIRLDPGDPSPYVLRGLIRQTRAEYREAAADFEAAVRAGPKRYDAYERAAWLLATCPLEAVRDGRRAVGYAEEAVRLRLKEDADLYATTAAAYAEAGDADTAVRWAERAAKASQGTDDDYREMAEVFRGGGVWEQDPVPFSRRVPVEAERPPKGAEPAK